MNDDSADAAADDDGDHLAFPRLYDRHAALVLSFCRKLDPPEADDAMQETFIRAHKLLAEQPSPTNPAAWLLAIARRVCSERRRAARRRAHHESIANDRRNTPLNHPPQPSDNIDRLEQLDRLDSALNSLTDDQRLAIHLHYLNPDSASSAPQTLGLSTSGYYKLLAQARARLAAEMQKAPVS